MRLSRPFYGVIAVVVLVLSACGDDDPPRPLLVRDDRLEADERTEAEPGFGRVARLEVRNGCVVALEEEGPPFPLVAIWPASAELTDDGVVLDGRTARFGEDVRLLVAVAPGSEAVADQVERCGNESVQYYTAILPAEGEVE